MIIDFVKINPTENMTVLVKNQIPRPDHKDLANKLMDYNSVFAEQVGFIEAPVDNQAEARLQMMGGEFCGNATMSLASYLTWKKQLPVGTSRNVLLEVSGAKSLLNCTVKVEDGYFRSKVKMPSAEKIEKVIINLEGKSIETSKVTVPGITHFIVESKFFDLTNQEKIGKLIESLAKGEAIDAIGIMFWDKQENYITPLVHVLSTNSTVWERGCGSGSAALGSFLAFSKKDNLISDIKQPGGTIRVFAEFEGEIWIEGMVKIAAEGRAYL